MKNAIKKHSNQYGKLNIFACIIEENCVSLQAQRDSDETVSRNCFKELILQKRNGTINEIDLNKMFEIYIQKLDRGELYNER